MITVLLVDDHPVVIEGLRKVLATAGDISVTGEAHDAGQDENTYFACHELNLVSVRPSNRARCEA